jgi:S-adenosylmethionine:tRNA ribosyltransferase-isomerase
MLLSEFDYTLPPERIAQAPVLPRDSSRLLHLKKGGGLADFSMRDLPEQLRPSDLLVFNNTKVIPARLHGKRGTMKAEVTLHQIRGDNWEVFAKPTRRLRVGERIDFADDFSAEIIDKTPEGRLVIRFNVAAAELPAVLVRYGQMPLPPYIHRDAVKTEDFEQYQTIFASQTGAVAAPTAGLHFTDELLKRLHQRGIESCFVTLHVGGGTFLPVKTDDISKHRMHAEQIEISAETAERINQAKQEGRRIVAVGTTSLRCLEAVAAMQGNVTSYHGATDIFITPPYSFRVVDALLTNFHLPKSTLLMLVSAFAGIPEIRAAYRHAIAQEYRFFSYGDACLLERNDALCG